MLFIPYIFQYMALS